jgi:hypothetical protein
LKAFDYHPPLHPYEDLSQSTNCCSDNERSVPVLMKCSPSIAAVAEKAQHDPHCAWFFTALTAPLVLQSTVAVRFEASRYVTSSSSWFGGILNPFNLFDSYLVMVENMLCPTVNESWLALISLISASFCV